MSKIDTENSNVKHVLKLQQGELDAVLVYRWLAAKISDDKKKQLFLQMASDEGTHATILKNISQIKLTPKHFKSLFISAFYLLFGLNATLRILIKGELSAVPVYEALSKQYPEVSRIKNDEAKHAAMLTTLKTK